MRIKARIRRFFGIDLIREDILLLEQRLAKIEERVELIYPPVVDSHFRIRHIQSFFGTTPDDAPLTREELATRNPWDAT